MAGTTPKRVLPYPTNGDVPNVAGDIAALATAVDDKLGSAKAVAIAGVETRANAAYGLLTTADQVTGLVVPANGLIRVRYRALWKYVGAGTTEAAIFIGANQLKGLAINAAPVALTQSMGATGDNYGPLYTNKTYGLATDESPTSDSSIVTTGFIVGTAQGDDELSIDGLPAGTYTVSVQFKAATGTVSVKERVLRARVQTYE